MNDDLTKKQKPSDGDNEGSANNFQDENDEFGLEKYGYDLKYKEDEGEDVNKQKKNDNDEDEEDKDAESRKRDEMYNKTLKELEELRKAREEKRKKDLGKMREKDEKKEKEKEKKQKQWEDTDEKQEKQKKKLIAGEKVERKRIFTHKKEEGVFRHKKLASFSTKGVQKINKGFKKVHGISLKKKQRFVELLKFYNPSETALTKKAFNDFSRRFKSKRFTGPNFNRMKKEGIDLKSARKKFGKRDLDKLRRGVTGEKDPHKYQRKSSSQKNSGSKNLSSGIAAGMR